MTAASMKRAAHLWLVGLFSLSLLAEQAPRPPFDAKTFPARDSHQGVTLAVDPYLRSERAKAVFGDHAPNRAGVLPVELIITNDSADSIRIDLERCQLILSRTKKLDPLETDAILNHLYRTSVELPEPVPRRRPLPLPLPKSKKKPSSKEIEAAEADFRSKAFRLDVIASHSSARGFLFFYVGLPLELPPGAVFYLPSIEKETTGEPLLYFEINLAAANSGKQPPAK